MIAKVIPNRAAYGPVRCAFAARVKYICDKAAAIETANLAGEWTDAAAQMRMTHGLSPNIRHPAAHIVLTWPETERPTDRQMIFAARMAMIDFCAGAHQMLIAVHRDRINSHVHILLNRIHPMTGRALSMSHDYARLELICRRLEKRMGWSADRGRFGVIDGGGGLHLAPKPAAHWHAKLCDREAGLRPDGSAVRAQELRTGLPSLRDFLPPPIFNWLRRHLDKADDWQTVHQTPWAGGLRYVVHKAGARIAQMNDLGPCLPVNWVRRMDCGACSSG